MKERGMIFNAEMVRALLSGNKTQTRRPVNPQPLWVYDGKVPVKTQDANPKGEIRCPFGQVDDRVYVRETFAITTNVNAQDDWPGRPNKIIDDGECVICRADGGWNWCDDDGFDTEKSYWKPSIHMPRWASRITLEVTDVRVERLQDMTDDDARHEGIEDEEALSYPCSDGYYAGYSRLWQSIYGNWDDNPWVWVIKFKVLK